MEHYLGLVYLFKDELLGTSDGASIGTVGLLGRSSDG